MPFDSQTPAEVTARDRMIQLRDHIAKLSPKHFDMCNWDCGTSACIGGWIARLFIRDRYQPFNAHLAAELVGLPYPEAEELFFMVKTDFPMHKVKRKHAVAVLDHYLATGEINWSVANAVR